MNNNLALVVSRVKVKILQADERQVNRLGVQTGVWRSRAGSQERSHTYWVCRTHKSFFFSTHGPLILGKCNRTVVQKLKT